MLRYALGRLLGTVPTMFLVILLAFSLVHAAPGNPFDTERSMAPEVRERLEARYALDQPLYVQFQRYVGGLLRGDFGPSMRYTEYTVSELIGESLPVSLTVGGLAMLLAILLGATAGTIAALRQNRFTDHAVMTVSMTGISVPNFVVAPLLVLLFAVTLRWLPAGGLYSPAHYVMPVLVLALPQVAYIARLMRGSLIEVLHSQFIRTARAQGLRTSTIVLRYALKPALVPVVSYLGPAAAAVLTGSVIVEQIFNLPGLGRHFVQGALNRDYTLVMGVVVLYSAMVIAFNFLVDLAYGLLDPRVRYS
jgi:oligopeptide transport system permease protein